MTKKTKEQDVVVQAPNLQTGVFYIRGTSPYVQCAFSKKAREIMRKQQEAGSTSRKNKAKIAKDFQAAYEQSMHVSTEGWNGIPAPAFRNAMVSACRLVGFAMTRAKLCVFIEPDGFDAYDGTPLVRIVKGEPKYAEHAVRIQQTTDLRARAMWDPGWEATVRVRFDADQFTLEDVGNLMLRIGMQVGIGEGRPDSRTSCGMGWGLFELIGKE